MQVKGTVRSFKKLRSEYKKAGFNSELAHALSSYIATDDLDRAIVALEKRIPQKPIVHMAFLSELYYCAQCRERLSKLDRLHLNGGMYKHCPKCGQAIDWSEERC